MVVVIDSSAPGRVARFRPAWRKCMAMTRRPTSAIGFIGLQATNTIGYRALLAPPPRRRPPLPPPPAAAAPPERPGARRSAVWTCRAGWDRVGPSGVPWGDGRGTGQKARRATRDGNGQLGRYVLYERAPTPH